MLILMLDSNLGSIFCSALTGNTSSKFPGSRAKDLPDQLIELIISIFRADLREVEVLDTIVLQSQNNYGFVTSLFPWRCQLVGNLVLMGWCKLCLTLPPPSPSASLAPFSQKIRPVFLVIPFSNKIKTLHYSSALCKRCEQTVFSFQSW